MISFRHPGTVLTDRFFAVPLDHQRPDGEQIEVFAREVVAADKADADLPWLLFLQGGPGFGAQRPEGRDTWLNRALEDYRVLLLDQRGTGRSSPANRKTLARLAAAGPQAQADYLTHFRADSIVLDAELIRRELTGEPWSVLGQSFGGMCAVTYLSFAPHGVKEAFITGGLPGLTATADDVYRHTYRTVAARNAAHYERYPQDADMARRVADYLDEHEVRLPDGAPLTVRAFQSAGAMLGQADGSHALHYLLEDPFAGDELSDAFLYAMMDELSFASGPLYALLHEACYAQGCATRWAAQRIRAEFAEFDPGVRGINGVSGPAVLHRRDDLPLDDRRRSGAAPAPARPPASWPNGMTGRPCTTRPGWPRTRCRRPPRSTTTTCTWTASSRCGPPRPSAACGPG